MLEFLINKIVGLKENLLKTRMLRTSLNNIHPSVILTVKYYYDLKTVCKLSYKCENLMFISDFFQREIGFYRGKCLCSNFDHVAKIQENKK